MTVEEKTLFAKKCLLSVLGSAILAFGLCHIHAYSGVTEGGVLGLTLLFKNHWALSPAVTGFILNAACYLFGIKTLGRDFLIFSLISGGGFSLFYALFDCFEPFFPFLLENTAANALLSAIFGALFVGIGVGLCIRAGGAPTGDDALAMSLSKITKLDIRIIYLISDLTVLSLSLSYIPIKRIAFSLLTVILSGQIIGLLQKPLPRKRHS